MPTIAINSSSGRPGAVGAAIATGAGALPSSSPRRCSARTAGVGWSNTRVAESRSPVAALSRLRSSTAVSESTPSAVKALWAPTAPASVPSTVATSVRTSWSSAASRSASSGRAVSRWASEDCSPVLTPARAVRRAGRTSPRSSGATGSPVAASAARSSGEGTRTGAPGSSPAASNSAAPSAEGSGRMPSLANRARSVWPSRPVMPLACSHWPQARDCAGRPSACRCAARASRKVFAAA